MAYLTFTASEEKNSSFKFIGANSNVQHGGLISDNISLISNCTSLLASDSDSGMDSCSFYSGPSDDAIMAFGESFETTGSIAYSDGGSYGGYTGSTESCGSIASSSVSSGSSFSGGGCSYSC